MFIWTCAFGSKQCLSNIIWVLLAIYGHQYGWKIHILWGTYIMPLPFNIKMVAIFKMALYIKNYILQLTISSHIVIVQETTHCYYWYTIWLLTVVNTNRLYLSQSTKADHTPIQQIQVYFSSTNFRKSVEWCPKNKDCIDKTGSNTCDRIVNMLGKRIRKLLTLYFCGNCEVLSEIRPFLAGMLVDLCSKF